MSIELEYRKFEIERVVDEIIGKVPENKLAKLMYYLECVFTVIESEAFCKRKVIGRIYFTFDG